MKIFGILALFGAAEAHTLAQCEIVVREWSRGGDCLTLRQYESFLAYQMRDRHYGRYGSRGGYSWSGTVAQLQH